MSLKYGTLKKNRGESTSRLIDSTNMDVRSSTSSVWLPMDDVDSRPGTQYADSRCSSTFWLSVDYEEPNTSHQTQCDDSHSRYSLNPATANDDAAAKRRHYASLPKCCFLPASIQSNEDHTETSIEPTTANNENQPMIFFNVLKDKKVNNEELNKFMGDVDSNGTKNNKKSLMALPANNTELYDTIRNKTPIPVKPRHYANLPNCQLTVPEVENKRSRSYNAFDNSRIPTSPKTMRRTLSRVYGHDTTEKFRDTWSVTANRVARLNTRLLDAIEYHNNVEVESMLHSGANPNATCRAGHISACHAAAYTNSDALHFLIKFNVDKNRRDKFGRTPLHLAAWAGRNWSIAMLLDFPIDLQYKVLLRVTPEAEEEIKVLRHKFAPVIDVPCELSILAVIPLPQSWKDSIEHKCRKYMNLLPKFFAGCTPLHIASYAAHYNATRLLLVAGANPNCKDAMGQTPLDIVGAACYLESGRISVDEYVKTIKSLIEFGGKLNVSETTSPKLNSALHTAVKLCSVEAIHELLAAGAPVCHQNLKGNTPLHECVEKFCEEPLQVLAKHQGRGRYTHSVDVINRDGYTVLHSAIMASWIPGVCVALDAGAVAICEAHDGKTAIHIAALKGDMDILDEILLNAAQYKNAVNYDNGRTEPPIFCAIRSGNLECVQALIDAGAWLKMTYYVEPNLGDTTMEPYLLSIEPKNLKTLNMILHATAEAGNVDILELLLDHDKSLQNLLSYKCPYLMSMIPVEFAAHYNRFYTFRYLLQKTLERAHKLQETFDHSRLLHIIATRNHEDMFRELINQIPDAVHIANGKGFYPLHDAARNCNRNLIVQLIHNGADLSETDKYGTTAMSVVIDTITKPTEFLAKIFDDYIITRNCRADSSDCEVIVDYRALIPTTADTLKNKGQMRVLTALLKTGNRQNQRKLLAHPLIESFLYLKWKTLSTYFYLMVFLYCLFVMSLSVFTVSVFYYSDKHNKSLSEYPHIPPMWTPNIWKYIIYVTLGIVVIQELSCTNLAPRKWVYRMNSIEFWIKLIAYSFAIALSQIVSAESVMSEISPGHVDWQRHLATVTLIMTWLNIMMLLSKTPMSGYYMQMFWMVSSKIIQILITFFFLILMFSFCFMVQFHATEPFEGPWASVVKTMVMMTSEFDYSGTFTRDKAKSLTTPIQFLRVIFVIFLILTAIVLMNLTIGVAVHDVQYLIQDGNLKRLDKQVGFLNGLEVSRGKKSFFHFLGLYRWFNCKNVPQTVTIKPVNDDDCCYSSSIKDSIINKAQEQLIKIEREAESSKVEMKLEKMTQSMRDIELNVLHHITDLKLSLQQAQDSINQTTSGHQIYGQDYGHTYGNV